MKRFCLQIVTLALLLILSSCSSTYSGNITKSNHDTYLNSGTIILSSIAPKELKDPKEIVEELAEDYHSFYADSGSEILLPNQSDSMYAEIEESSAPNLLGYFPSKLKPEEKRFKSPYIIIDSNKNTLKLFKDGQLKLSQKIQDQLSIEKGIYKILLKQEFPKWYAPDSYYTKRGLNIPPAGDKSRYLRGALGRYVMYPKSDFPIHSAPSFFTNYHEEIGGLRLSEQDLKLIFELINIGDNLVVD